MPSFKNGDIELAYLDEGERSASPIVLVHGFASSKEVNWVYPGWVTTLTAAGRRVVAPDNRGHGKSSKLYDPADYHTQLMDRMATMLSQPDACTMRGLFRSASISSLLKI